MATVTIGDRNTNVTEGSNLTLQVGNGKDTIAAGSNDTITIGIKAKGLMLRNLQKKSPYFKFSVAERQNPALS
jgi:hypothetical protein